MPAVSTQINNAITELISRLQPVVDIGIEVKSISDYPGALGSTGRAEKGTIVITYDRDADWVSTNSAGGTQQAYKTRFNIMGRLDSVKTAEGFYAIRDAVLRLLGGIRLPGYTGPTEILEFTPSGRVQGRAETYWGFACIIAIPGVLVTCEVAEGIGEDDIIEGVETLLQSVEFTDGTFTNVLDGSTVGVELE